MPLDKPSVDFHELALQEGWEPAPGAGPGIEQKLLSGALDEANRAGARTRLIRFRPGAFNEDVFVHDYWEEVYLIEGELIVGHDNGAGGELYRPPAYACRPPGTPHGPFKSDTGCLFFEIQYYA